MGQNEMPCVKLLGGGIGKRVHCLCYELVRDVGKARLESFFFRMFDSTSTCLKGKLIFYDPLNQSKPVIPASEGV